MVKMPNPAAPETVEVKVEVEDPLDEEHGPSNKRSKPTAPQQETYNNILDEPSPLGLRLRKSPSLLDLIQKSLSETSSSNASCITSTGISESGKKKEIISTAVSGSTDRLKASNFAADILRIGNWECVSRYEVDLVAKFYFAKQKLVWEILAGGLKSKIEIQWSEITALKATFPEKGPGTLDIVLARPPLFFRETDPLPRKHTIWQASTDFTGGQASIHRRHFLQGPRILLRKNFEKLVQCDPHLNFLSQQADVVLKSPYFEPRGSVSEEDQPEPTQGHDFSDQKDDYVPSFSGFSDLTSSSAASSISTKSKVKGSVGRTPKFVSEATCSPRSGVVSISDTQAINNNGTCGTEDMKNCNNWWDQLKVPGLRGSMSVDDLVNHIGSCISEQMASGSPSLPRLKALPTKEILEDVAQYLLSDTQASSASDEKSLMARVNSLCCLIHKDTPVTQDPQTKNSDDMAGDADLESSDDDPDLQLDKNSGHDAPPPPVSRTESFGDLLMHLPRIASFPQFLFNISEDSENEAR
ncbi:uncharacterized protein [Typha latifolia]|uniref:uncharacterized protein isoform X1 n=1 Tax=Typha latifolia TaxID=4733 RepID=UPI003C2B5931